MPYQRVTKTPIDLSTTHSLNAGDLYDLQAVSGESAIYYVYAENAPMDGSRGMRLETLKEPQIVKIPEAPRALWVWAETGKSADLFFEPSSGSLGVGGGGGGSGCCGVYAPIYQNGSTTFGVEIGIDKDTSWALDARDRDHVGAPSRSTLSGSGGSSLRLEMPRSYIPSSEANDWDVYIEQGIEHVNPVMPSTLIQGIGAGDGIAIQLPDSLIGTPVDGNDWIARVQHAQHEIAGVTQVLPAARVNGTSNSDFITVNLPEGLVQPSLGAAWNMRVQAGHPAVLNTIPAVQATADITGQTASDLITVTMPSNLAAGADSNGWHLRVEEGNPAVAPATQVLPRAIVDGDGAATMEVILPADFVLPGDGNDWDLRLQLGNAGTLVNEVLPSLTYRGSNLANSLEVRLPNTLVTPSSGNEWSVRVTSTEPRSGSQNAYARIRNSNGEHFEVAFAGTNSNILGLSGNDWSFAFNRLTAGTSSISINETTKTVTLNYNFSSLTSSLVPLFNNFTQQNNIGFTARLLGGTTGSNAAGTLTLITEGFEQGGTITAGSRRASIDVTNKRIELSINRNDTINQIATLLRAASWTDSGGTNRTLGTAHVLVSGSGTDALSENDYYPDSPGTTTSRTFPAGTDFVDGTPRDPISATIDTTNERIVLSLLPDRDSFDDIAPVIRGLSYTPIGGGATTTFGTGSVTGDLGGGALLTPLNTPTAGNPVDLSFTGGVTATTGSARDPLSVTISTDGLFIIVEAIATDTIADVVTALEGASYTAGGTPTTLGSANVSTSSTTTTTNTLAATYFAGDPGTRDDTAFTGGSNQIDPRARDPLSATVDATNSRIVVVAISTDTIAQVVTALAAATYTDRDGVPNRTIGTSHVVATGTTTNTLASSYFTNVGDTDDTTFSAGVDEVIAVPREPLSATIDADNERITIIVDDNDTIPQIGNVIAGANYTDSDGNSQQLGTGNVTTTGLGRLSQTRYFGGAIGSFIDESFSGGINEVIGTPLSAALEPDDEVLRIIAQSTHTLTQISTAIDNISFTDVDGNAATFGTATPDTTVISGGGNNTLSNIDYFQGSVGSTSIVSFAGGRDPVPLSARVDNSQKKVFVLYDQAQDNLQAIADMLGNTNGILSAVLVYGTTATAQPESNIPPILRAFTRGGLGGVVNVTASQTQIEPSKLGNVYRAVASGVVPARPANNSGTATASGITVAPTDWSLTRPDATETLPDVYTSHVLGYTIDGTFSWQFTAPDRTDRYVTESSGTVDTTEIENDIDAIEAAYIKSIDSLSQNGSNLELGYTDEGDRSETVDTTLDIDTLDTRPLVRYDAQSLTDSQENQVRSNIEAASSGPHQGSYTATSFTTDGRDFTAVGVGGGYFVDDYGFRSRVTGWTYVNDPVDEGQYYQIVFDRSPQITGHHIVFRLALSTSSLGRDDAIIYNAPVASTQLDASQRSIFIDSEVVPTTAHLSQIQILAAPNTIAHDDTLDGDGTTPDPLGLSNLYGIDYSADTIYRQGRIVAVSGKLYIKHSAGTTTGVSPADSGQTDWRQWDHDVDGGGTMAPPGNARGDLLFSTSAMPVGTDSNEINVDWTKASTAPTYMTLDTYTSSNFERIDIGRSASIPSEVIGLWAVSKVAGTETDRTFIGWSVLENTGAANQKILRFSNSQHVAIMVAFRDNSSATTEDVWQIIVQGKSTTLPADSTIEIYWAIVRGDQGPTGGGLSSVVTDGVTLRGTGVDAANAVRWNDLFALAEWDATTTYGAGTVTRKSMVIYLQGKGSDSVGEDPVTNMSVWAKLAELMPVGGQTELVDEPQTFFGALIRMTEMVYSDAAPITLTQNGWANSNITIPAVDETVLDHSIVIYPQETTIPDLPEDNPTEIGLKNFWAWPNYVHGTTVLGDDNSAILIDQVTDNPSSSFRIYAVRNNDKLGLVTTGGNPLTFSYRIVGAKLTEGNSRVPTALNEAISKVRPDQLSQALRTEHDDFEVINAGNTSESTTIEIPKWLAEDRERFGMQLKASVSAHLTGGDDADQAVLDILNGSDVIETSNVISVPTAGITSTLSFDFPATATSLVARVSRSGNATSITINNLVVDVLPEYLDPDAVVRYSTANPTAAETSTDESTVYLKFVSSGTSKFYFSAKDTTSFTELDLGGGSGGTAETDLGIANRTATTLDITSSSGADATLPAATTTQAGLITKDEKNKLDGVYTGANKIVTYKIGNIYRAVASGTSVTKPGDGTGSGSTAVGVVTESGITTAPDGWQTTRPEPTTALPWVFDCHVYGYTINDVFHWQYGAANRTDVLRPNLQSDWTEADTNSESFIQNKPTVPTSFAPTDAEANVQSNWNESDTTSDAFIQNKPTLAPSNAEQNVQSNWSEANTNSDSFIQNKPTIPSSYAPTDAEANVQADWTESDSTSDAFIQNKPTLAPSNAEENVKSDWTEADTTSDAYIENKPDLSVLDDTLYAYGALPAASVDDWGGKYVLQLNEQSSGDDRAIGVYEGLGSSNTVRFTLTAAASGGHMGYVRGSVGSVSPDVPELLRMRFVTNTTTLNIRLADKGANPGPTTVRIGDETVTITAAVWSHDTANGWWTATSGSFGFTSGFAAGQTYDISITVSNDADYFQVPGWTQRLTFDDVTSGQGDPTGGKQGNLYIEVNSSNQAVALWTRGESSWTEYALATGGGGENNVQADWTEADTTSDAYIQNKPTIPTTFAPVDAEQNVQADWTEADSTNDAFIQNKPTLPSSYAPTDAEANVQSNWDETDTSDDAFIQNKPDLNNIERTLYSYDNLPTASSVDWGGKRILQTNEQTTGDNRDVAVYEGMPASDTATFTMVAAQGSHAGIRGYERGEHGTITPDVPELLRIRFVNANLIVRLRDTGTNPGSTTVQIGDDTFTIPAWAHDPTNGWYTFSSSGTGITAFTVGTTYNVTITISGNDDYFHINGWNKKLDIPVLPEGDYWRSGGAVWLSDELLAQTTQTIADDTTSDLGIARPTAPASTETEEYYDITWQDTAVGTDHMITLSWRQLQALDSSDSDTDIVLRNVAGENYDLLLTLLSGGNLALKIAGTGKTIQIAIDRRHASIYNTEVRQLIRNIVGLAEPIGNNVYWWINAAINHAAKDLTDTDVTTFKQDSQEDDRVISATIPDQSYLIILAAANPTIVDTAVDEAATSSFALATATKDVGGTTYNAWSIQNDLGTEIVLDVRTDF